MDGLGVTPENRWRLYKTASGRHVVREELDALGIEPGQMLGSCMKRLLRGELLPREDEALTDSGGLRALRVFRGNDPFRLIYARDGRRILLALRAVYKDQRKLSRTEIDLARDRLRDWRARGGSV